MRIVISGATSMIGSALVNRLTKQNHEVIAIVRNNCSKLELLNNNSKLTIIECDMNRFKQLVLLINKPVDVAFAFAWDGTRGGARNDSELQKYNYYNCVDFLQATLNLGCKKFFTAGSQAEYGICTSKDKVTEEYITVPNTEYGIYKLKFYKYAKSFCEQNNCVLIEPRFFSLYGPKDYAGTLIMSTINKMINNEVCELTECIQLWDFLYIDDAIDGLIMLMNNKEAYGVYNFGSGYSKPLKYYIEKMKIIMNSTSELKYGMIPYPNTGIVNVNPNVNKLKKIGWIPKISFEEGIEIILKVLLQNNNFNFKKENNHNKCSK